MGIKTDRTAATRAATQKEDSKPVHVTRDEEEEEEETGGESASTVAKPVLSKQEMKELAAELFGNYEEAEHAIKAAEEALEAAVRAKSDAVKAIGEALGTDKVHRWRDSSGTLQSGTIVKRMPKGGGDGGEANWFFRSERVKETMDWSK